MAFKETLMNLAATFIASVILIVLGIVYFMLTVIIIRLGASWAGFPGIDGGTVVLTAGIVTAAALIGSAIQQ